MCYLGHVTSSTSFEENRSSLPEEAATEVGNGNKQLLNEMSEFIITLILLVIMHYTDLFLYWCVGWGGILAVFYLLKRC